jgi:hypothetical protein
MINTGELPLESSDLGEVTGPRSPRHEDIITNKSPMSATSGLKPEDDVAIFPSTPRYERLLYRQSESAREPPLQRLPSLDSASFGGDNRGEQEN